MAKRSAFPRMPRDLYESPPEVVGPLLPHIARGARFGERFAGRGALVRALEAGGLVCGAAWDIEPLAPGIERRDGLSIGRGDLAGVDLEISNSPWRRDVLHPYIERVTALGGWAWLLFDGDWLWSTMPLRFKARLHRVQAVGPVRWIAGSKHKSMDKAAWYLFGPPGAQTRVFVRGETVSAEDVMFGRRPRVVERVAA